MYKTKLNITCDSAERKIYKPNDGAECNVKEREREKREKDQLRVAKHFKIDGFVCSKSIFSGCLLINIFFVRLMTEKT